MSIRPKSKLLVGAVIGVVVAMSAAAVAQSPTPAVPTGPQTVAPAPVAPAPTVVAPVVPTAPAQNPGALAAIEQSVAPAPAPGAAVPVQVVAAPGSIVQTSGPAPYVVPPAGPGIFQGSEQTLREIAFLQTEVALNAKRKEHVDSVAALEAAKKDLSDQLSGKTKDDKGASSGGPSGAGGPLPEGGAPVVAAPVKPEPYVNSVYGYGNDMYAEIILGQTKILATKGTLLTDGSRVVSVSNSGVTISTKGRTKRLAIRGAAGF